MNGLLKMTKFKDLFLNKANLRKMENPSVSVSLDGHTLHLRLTSKDEILDACYEGSPQPWLTAMCDIICGMKANELSLFNWKNFEEVFQNDQSFWDFRTEEDEHFIHKHFELLHAALDLYRGRDYLYKDESPLVCRCFGVREVDIRKHLSKEGTPTLDSLVGETNAGMGCRTCVPQLKRWLVLHESGKGVRAYKHKPIADWLLDIDYMLSCFPKAADWKMEVQSFKGQQVSISFEKKVTQREEEETARELQDFLAASVDDGLAFFLRRARHFSKARG